MEILLIGAGAVGQVYGRHLQLGGANVTFYVREKYKEEVSSGFTMYPWSQKKNLENPVSFSEYSVITTTEEISQQKWDQVYLCISSTALRAGWLPEIIESIGEATLVSLQPGIEDKDYILQYIKDEQIVSGMISFSSYTTPLATESTPISGMAYWFPPLTPSPFSGSSKQRVKDVVAPLKKGKFPCSKVKDVNASSAVPSAFLMHFIAALEKNNWSFKQLGKSGEMKLVSLATREVLPILAKKYAPPLPNFIIKLSLNRFLLQILLNLAPKVIPFDIESFMKYHFLKVKDQTLLFLENYLKYGKKEQLPTTHIQQLYQAIKPDNETKAST